MQENFEELDTRVYFSLLRTDLSMISYELDKLKEPTLVSGVGGSAVVANFASKVLAQKNNIITRKIEPRDFTFINLSNYKNVLSCSYSGNNYGVDLAFKNNLNHYLLSAKENNSQNIKNLTYDNSIPEHSFISIAATLIPCSIFLNYYLDFKGEDGAIYITDNLLNKYNYDFDVNCDAYEIFSGCDTSTASIYLESTMIEAGIGIPIVHDKYSYCHGRSTLSTAKNNIAIFYNTSSELDKLLLSEISAYYKEVIIIDFKPRFFNDKESLLESIILDDYISLLKSMYLTKYIAEQLDKDLSGVDYNPIVRKICKFKGDI